MSVKIIGIHASPRKAATAFALQYALQEAGKIEGVEIEFLELRKRELHPCIHCNRCMKEGVFTCPAFSGDGMEEFYEKIPECDGLILATPVYDMAPSAQAHIFMNRLRPLGRMISKGVFATKVGLGIAVGGARNGGQETTLQAINNFFLCQGFCLAGAGVFAYAGASVWSRDKMDKGVAEDAQGLSNIKIAARRMAMMAKVIKAGKEAYPSVLPSQFAGFENDEHRDAVTFAFRNKQ